MKHIGINSGASVFAAFSLLLTAGGLAATPEPNDKPGEARQAADQPGQIWRVAIDLQIVAVSRAEALKLIPALEDPLTFDAAFARIQQMIVQDEAELIDWPTVILAAGVRGVSESAFEPRYPTEFKPPGIPQTFMVPDPTPDSDTRAWAMPPTAFETRPTGVFVEAMASVSKAGDLIGLSVFPQRVFLLGYQSFRGEKNAAGILGLIEQPNFSTVKTESHLTVRSGKRMLFGTYVETKPKARVLLFLLKAIATPAGDNSGRP